VKLSHCACGEIVWEHGATQCSSCKQKGKFPNKGARFIVCHWCLSSFIGSLTACPDCGQPKDINKSLQAKKRQKMGYLDYVREGARKAGKNVGVAVKRARSLKRNGEFSEQNSKDLLRKINAYLHKGKKQPPSPWAHTLVALRKCVLCKTEYPPLAVNQKYCDECKKVAERTRNKEWSRKHYVPRMVHTEKPPPKSRERQCAVCGRDYTATAGKQKYCAKCQAEYPREWNRNRYHIIKAGNLLPQA
jgi:hypothetical protein